VREPGDSGGTVQFHQGSVRLRAGRCCPHAIFGGESPLRPQQDRVGAQGVSMPGRIPPVGMQRSAGACRRPRHNSLCRGHERDPVGHPCRGGGQPAGHVDIAVHGQGGCAPTGDHGRISSLAVWMREPSTFTRCRRSGQGGPRRSYSLVSSFSQDGAARQGMPPFSNCSVSATGRGIVCAGCL
jgi:hypothetical protein